MSRRSRWKKLRRHEEAQMLHDGGHASGEGTEAEHTKEAHIVSEESHPRTVSHTHHEEHEKKRYFHHSLHDNRYTGIKGIYFNKYKTLLIIPFLLLAFALIQIAVQSATTGDFLHKAVSLKGGVTITITSEQAHLIDSSILSSSLSSEFPNIDIGVKKLKTGGETSGVIIEADIPENNEELLNSFLSAIEEETSVSRKEFSVEIMGSSLGASFFRETFIAVLIAFLCMGIVVFIYFRTFVPSIAVILAAFSDIIITLAIANVLGIKLSTAGIAAFLMLIGYSVDTDILLSTNLLKRKDGSLNERLIRAMKTGLLMTITTLSAVIVALIVSGSEVITQIMTILLIGLLVDLVNTWIQNVGILKIYLEKKARTGAK